MKPIRKDELYQHLSQFLKAKGVEMKDGSYPAAIQKGCSFLTDAINLSQKGISRAKGEVDRNLERMRQAIHEKTAPKPAAKAAAGRKATRAQKPKSRRRKPAASKR
jgi:hypothetical protein